MTKVTILSSAQGDWEAMYLDGKLVQEGHSLDPDRLVTNLLQHYVESLSTGTLTDEYTEGGGEFHHDLSRIPADAYEVK